MYRHFFALLILALCLDASAKGVSRSASRHRAAPKKTHSAPAKPAESAKQQAQPVQQQSSSSGVMGAIGGAVVGTMVGNLMYDALTEERPKPKEEEK